MEDGLRTKKKKVAHAQYITFSTQLAHILCYTIGRNILLSLISLSIGNEISRKISSHTIVMQMDIAQKAGSINRKKKIRLNND